ncbi:MAG: septum site-determining protein MinC [Pseudomonadota bacterium]
MSKLPAPGALEVKIATVVAVAATLHTADLTALDAALRHMTSGDSGFFDGEFAVVDVASIVALPAAQTIDWAAMVELFRHHGLNPVAVRNAAPAMQAGILAYGLSLDNSIIKPRADAAAEVAPVATSTAAGAASNAMVNSNAGLPMIVDMPVRAGQRIYARNTDLIVTAAVNNGAELIADGSIHVYAPMRGRALAGASGNVEARIFALSMEAELVSIAGVYRTFDDGYPDGVGLQPVQIRLAGDRLDIVGLQAVTRS